MIDNPISLEDIEVALATGINADKAIKNVLEDTDILYMMKPEAVATFFEKAVEMKTDMAHLKREAYHFIADEDLMESDFTEKELFDARERVNNALVSKGIYYQCSAFAEALAELQGKSRSETLVPNGFDSEADEAKWLDNMRKSAEEALSGENGNETESAPLRLGMYLFKKEKYIEAAKYFEIENKIEKSTEACAYLSHMYETGKGLKQSLVNAFKQQYQMTGTYFSDLCDLKMDEEVANLVITEDDEGEYEVVKNSDRLFDLLTKMNDKERIQALTILDGPSKDNDQEMEP